MHSPTTMRQLCFSSLIFRKRGIRITNGCSSNSARLSTPNEEILLTSRVKVDFSSPSFPSFRYLSQSGPMEKTMLILTREAITEIHTQKGSVSAGIIVIKTFESGSISMKSLTRGWVTKMPLLRGGNSVTFPVTWNCTGWRSGD